MGDHTPGPWMAKLTEDGDDEGGYGTYSPNGEVIPQPTDDDPDPEPICTMYSFNPADLALIAATPDLLAACDGLLDVLDWLGANLPEETIIPLLAGVLIEDKKIAAIKAVKKANGEA